MDVDGVLDHTCVRAAVGDFGGGDPAEDLPASVDRDVPVVAVTRGFPGRVR